MRQVTAPTDPTTDRPESAPTEKPSRSQPERCEHDQQGASRTARVDVRDHHGGGDDERGADDGVPARPPIRTTAAKRVIEARRHAFGRESLDLGPQAILTQPATYVANVMSNANMSSSSRQFAAARSEPVIGTHQRRLKGGYRSVTSRKA